MLNCHAFLKCVYEDIVSKIPQSSRSKDTSLEYFNLVQVLCCPSILLSMTLISTFFYQQPPRTHMSLYPGLTCRSVALVYLSWFQTTCNIQACHWGSCWGGHRATHKYRTTCMGNLVTSLHTGLSTPFWSGRHVQLDVVTSTCCLPETCDTPRMSMSS